MQPNQPNKAKTKSGDKSPDNARSAATELQLETANLEPIMGALFRLRSAGVISVNGCLILLRLWERGEGLTMTEIVNANHVSSPAAMTGLVDYLETQGLVERGKMAMDRRKIVVRLTASGKSLVADALELALATADGDSSPSVNCKSNAAKPDPSTLATAALA